MKVNPYEQTRFAAGLARIYSFSKVLISGIDFLEIFIIKAAKALGLYDEAGLPVVGKKRLSFYRLVRKNTDKNSKLGISKQLTLFYF